MIGATSGFLLAAAAGYWVLERAEQHKQGLRRVGRWLGGAIIVIALLGTTCLLTCSASGQTCPMMGAGKVGCPMTGSRAAATQTLP